jgi:ATP-dependent Zn protease
LPEDDQVSVTKKEYQAIIDVSMGGRIAEEISMLIHPFDEPKEGVLF